MIHVMFPAAMVIMRTTNRREVSRSLRVVLEREHALFLNLMQIHLSRSKTELERGR